MKKVPYILCCILLVVSMSTMNAYACTNAYFPWTWDSSVDTSNFSVRMCSSVYFFDSNVNSSIYAWNDISSKIQVTSYTSSTADFEGNDKNINIRETNLTGDTLGRTHCYYAGQNGAYTEIPTGFSGRVVQVRIELSPTLRGAYAEWKEMTVIHELGHAFGLRHPRNNACNEMCVMQTTGSGRATKTVNSHDRNNLISKWGR